ncbi:MAG TPA: hypothetical protein VFX42_08560, partial [Gemmatimonadales bacterium]|nr:hypothetical protein [Gemmatimonadales bacterium]
MRSLWPLALLAVLACSGGTTGSTAVMTSSALQDTALVAREAREAIPAEWTVAEDTSATGDITTASLQLPTAKNIAGFPGEESPRLILRCLQGRVAAFIAPEPSDSGPSDDTVGVAADLVPVQLDSA